MNSAQAIAAIFAALTASACGAVSARQAQANEASPQAREEKASAAAQPQRGNAAPSGKHAPKRKALRRRSVQQVIGTVQPVPVAPSYGPVLNTPPAVAPMLATPVAPPTIARPYGTVHVIPVAPPTVSPSYGPVLAMPSAPLPAPVIAPAVPPPPAAITTCTGSVCTDSSGNTYGTGTGNAAINSQGRLCNRVGNTMQCF